MARRFQIELSDETAKAFFNLTYSAGMTTNYLLQTFVRDLLGQDPTAWEYLNCCITPSADVSFSAWAIIAGRTAEVTELLETVQDAAMEMAMDHELSSEMGKVIGEAGQDLAAIYQEYRKDPIHQGRPVQSYEDAITDMKEYLRELAAV